MLNVTYIMPKTGIRKAALSDLPDIVRIYNDAVSLGGITCDIDLFTTEERVPWFESHQSSEYPLFVYEVDGDIAGYSHLSAYRAGRRAVEKVTEISYYVNKQYRKQGIGSLLVSHTINQAIEIGYEQIIAMIVEGNQGSENMLLKHGFCQWGRMPKVAVFNGNRHDHIYYGLDLMN
ncbi:GNAT family N-acetyltransferase [Desemzia incerta]|uniref:Phosphinothricin acetyltransferase n=1 Tax=Desemzia incerta TaxID=82801 RepID=A0A1I5UT58_9LACT|nr:GNAT family N-acetyltransferase [Desemzia incerta]SFP97916.1 phosphinothricin acetyltransferase [Desemzia incerta]